MTEDYLYVAFLFSKLFGLPGFAGLALWAWFRGWTRHRFYVVLSGWWMAMLLLSTHARDGEGLRGWTGFWIAFGLIGGIGILYGEGVRWLKARSRTSVQLSPSREAFTPAELERYARHILLREIGGPGQKRLKAAKVLVVGAGGLGSPVLLYLAGAGVGVIGVIDADVVESTNLQRQVIHTEARIGMPKVFSAELAMKALNPFIEVRPYNRAFDEANAADLVADYDLVLDGTDDFATRYLVNRACVAAGKPLISGALTQWEGQVSLFDPAKGGPCYACVFPVQPAADLVPSCAVAGVAAPLPGMIGGVMAMEAVKWITGAGEGLAGRLMIHDALFAETRVIGVKRREDCAVCGARH